MNPSAFIDCSFSYLSAFHHNLSDIGEVRHRGSQTSGKSDIGEGRENQSKKKAPAGGGRRLELTVLIGGSPVSRGSRETGAGDLKDR